MARTFETVAVLATALCFASFLGSVHCEISDYLNVMGRVYCDTCRVQFETKLTDYIEGATVRLECKNRETGALTFEKEATTTEHGYYNVAVDGDHEDDICEVSLVKSPREDCNEIKAEWVKDRVMVTKNNGAVLSVRYANSLGFMKKEALPGCVDALKEMGFLPLEDQKED